MTKELAVGKGEFGDMGGFAHEEFLIGLQEHFCKGGRFEIDLFAAMDKYNLDMDEVIGQVDFTVGEFISPAGIRIHRDGGIRLMFKTDAHEIVGIDAIAAKDVVPTAYEAIHAHMALSHVMMNFVTLYEDNKKRIGHRLPIVRRLNEALTAGEAVASLSAKAKAEVRREEFYKATEDENGMF